ncbi:MAG TPA: NADPH-dependent FMN reductase [Streptomyces sp.]|nr:NADPH-dependent FMN reductase [Streptomyces sp.]
MKVLALCGSLREKSLNASVLRSATDLFAPPWQITVDPGLDRLPFFNADVEETALPGCVADLRAAVQAADGLLIATPEYAHGTSGVLKNALEWLVGGGEIADKPVALVSASPAVTGGDHARAWLTQTLTVMGAAVLPGGLRIPQATRKIADGRIADAPTLAELRGLLEDLARAVATAREDSAALAP